MTMFEFMQNAFFLLCGIICIAAAVLVMCATGAVLNRVEARLRAAGIFRGDRGEI